jgi:hypothetical protein
VTVRPEIASRVLDGEAVILNLANGLYYDLGGSGAVIRALIQTGTPLGAIVADVCARFEAAPARVAADVEVLLADLLREGLVTEDAAGAAALAPPAPPSAGRAPYASPRMGKHADMAHFFTAEPPLPTLHTTPDIPAP